MNRPSDCLPIHENVADVARVMHMALTLQMGRACIDGDTPKAIATMRRCKSNNTMSAAQVRGIERYALARCIATENSDTCMDLLKEFPCICQEARDDALLAAIAAHRDYAFEPLLLNGASCNASIKGGITTTALVQAIRFRSEVAWTILLEHGADVKLADRDGLTALHYAAVQGNAPLCLRLLAQGADIEAATHCGETPLMFTIPGKAVNASIALIRLGALLGPLNHNGKSALAMAIENHSPQVMEVLVAAGASAKGLASDEHPHVLKTSRIQASIRLGDAWLIEQAVQAEEAAHPKTFEARVRRACRACQDDGLEKSRRGVDIALALMAARAARQAVDSLLGLTDLRPSALKTIP